MKMAISLFEKKGYVLVDVSYATKNSSADLYWVEPVVEMLEKKWCLILNDNIRRDIKLFIIPALSININEMRRKSNNTKKAKIYIKYNDPTFMDTLSEHYFAKFLVDTIKY